MDPLVVFVWAVLLTPNPLPPLSDALYLPSHDACRNCRMAASANYNRLRFEWNDGPEQWWHDLAVADAHYRWRVWDTAEDAQSPHYHESQRREKLARLRDLIGCEDYRHMRLPEPVAPWHLADETGRPPRSHVPELPAEGEPD